MPNKDFDEDLLRFESVTLLDIDLHGIYKDAGDGSLINKECKMHGKVCLVRDKEVPNEEPELVFVPCMYTGDNMAKDIDQKIIRRREENIPAYQYTEIASAVDFFKLNKFFDSSGKRYVDTVMKSKNKILPGIAPILTRYKVKMGSTINKFTGYRFDDEILKSIRKDYRKQIENQQDEMMGRKPRHILDTEKIQ